MFNFFSRLNFILSLGYQVDNSFVVSLIFLLDIFYFSADFNDCCSSVCWSSCCTDFFFVLPAVPSLDIAIFQGSKLFLPMSFSSQFLEIIYFFCDECVCMYCVSCALISVVGYSGHNVLTTGLCFALPKRGRL